MDRKVCADCGKELVRSRSTEYHGTRHFDADGHGVCRTEQRDGRLVAADYHYVEGEEQTRWRIEHDATSR
jgi:hypothetical protein